MKVIKTIIELQKEIAILQDLSQDKKVAFVPTMGALHFGHISLINEALKVSENVICSVFVNPKQFNNQEDLNLYPRTESADIEILKNSGCKIVFIPSTDEIYPKNETNYKIDLGYLDQIMEGKHRKGHFEGVCRVVERLFEIVNPTDAFFGSKDFQQVAVIKHMVKLKKIPVEIHACPIIRETTGLAMSSRNARLSDEEKNKATILYQALLMGKKMYQEKKEISMIINEMSESIQSKGLEIEYIEIVDTETLLQKDAFENNTVCCLAVYCGKVRLIDNMIFS